MSTLITGIAGQDGSYLAQQLLADGELVIGTVRPGAPETPLIRELQKQRNCELTSVDMLNLSGLRTLLRNLQPERVIHLAAVSRPQACEEDPVESRTVNVSSSEVIIDWLRRERPQARVLLTSSAMVFGNSPESPQKETTLRNPVSEYGRQKQAVSELARKAREEGLFAACAIPFNHESPRRSEDFVFAKIVNSAARIKLGLQGILQLGALNAGRDWGYAPEYARAMAWMLEVDRPLELVLATGELHSVGELVRDVFEYLDLDLGVKLKHSEDQAGNGNPSHSIGDPTMAWNELGWEPKTRYAQLWRLMLEDAQERYAANASDNPAV